jgi:hypothetical protein
MKNLNKNDGKSLQKIENFKDWEFEFGQVFKYEFDYIDEDEISLQLHIIATNLKTKEEKIFAFQNGGSGHNGFEQENWYFYQDGSENVVKSEGFNYMDENDDDLIEYLNEYLDKYNYAKDYSVDDIIN